MSKVANSMSFSKTCLSSLRPYILIKPFIVVDFPVLVYPTKATLGMSFLSRRWRCTLAEVDISLSSWLMWLIRLRIVRRFNSSLVSPAPRLVNPPPVFPAVCWSSRWVALVRKRGSWYCNLASSTWRRASFERARLAKISKIKPVRSMTRNWVSFSKLLSWLGVNSSLTTRVSTSRAAATWVSSSIFPFPK